jgi:hypothetical protein
LNLARVKCGLIDTNGSRDEKDIGGKCGGNAKPQ